MKLKLRAAAERDPEASSTGAWRSSARTWPKGYLIDLQAGMDRLLLHPQLGADTGLRPGLRVLGVREHRVFYRVELEAVVVARVLHKAMDVTRHV